MSLSRTRKRCVAFVAPASANKKGTTTLVDLIASSDDRDVGSDTARESAKGGETMDLKVWAPFADLDKEWRFDFPRLVRETGEFRPSLDVVKTDSQMILTAELAGIDPKDVEVSLDGDILTIKGEKSDEREASEADRYIHERTFGSYQRRIIVPEGVTTDDIAADFDNGILTVRVSIPEEKAVEPRRIPVGTK
jgi:HSP20 family protein